MSHRRLSEHAFRYFFFFSSRRRHTRCGRDWSSDVCSSDLGNYAQALSLFDDILEVDPSNVNALIGKAVAYRRRGKAQEALNCLDLVLGVQPGNASALLNRGNILLDQGNAEPALESI